MRLFRGGFFLAVALSCATSAVAADPTSWSGGGPDLGWVTHLSRPLGPLGPVFAGTYGGGLFRSDDGGLSWTDASSNARDAVVWDLERGEDGSYYLATEDRGVLRLDANAGSFWLEVNAGLNDPFLPFVYATEIHPGDPLRVSAASSNGVYTSRNRGGQWPDSLKVIVGEPVRDLLVMPELPNTLHAIGDEQLFVASGWVGLPTAIDAPDVLRDGQLVPNTLFDLTRWPGTTDSLLVVDFQGAVFQLQGRSQLVRIGPDVPTARTPRLYRAQVALAGSAPSIYVGGDAGLFCTHNRGQLWQRFTGGLPTEQPEIWSLLVEDASRDELLLGSFVYGVLHAVGDTAWQTRNDGLRAAWVRAVDAHAGELLIGTAHGSVWYGTDGHSWTDVTGDLVDLQVNAVHLGREGGAWLASAFAGAYRSPDRGASWSALSMPAGVTRVDRFVAPTWPGATSVYANTDDGLVVSDDDGATWRRVVGPPTGRPSFAIATADVARVVAVAFDPPVGTTAPPSLWIGDDVGNWREVVLAPGFRGRIRGLAFLDAQGSSVAVASTPTGTPTSPLVYRIDGLGPLDVPEFTSIAPMGATGDFFPVDLLSDPSRGLLVLALDVDGVLVSADAGAQWTQWSEGLDTLRMERLALDRAPLPGAAGRVVAGTFARGAWVRERPDGVAVAVDGPWIERTDDAVSLRFSVRGVERARVDREAGPRVDRRWEGDPREGVSVREDLESLRMLDADVVRWIVEVETDGSWSEVASVQRDLADLVRRLSTGLLASAPNPFNPRTSIRWEQARAGEVTIDLLDLRGRVVRRLLRAERNAGRHSVPWDGTDDRSSPVASGSYVVRLSIDGRSWTDRVTLVR